MWHLIGSLSPVFMIFGCANEDNDHCDGCAYVIQGLKFDGELHYFHEGAYEVKYAISLDEYEFSKDSFHFSGRMILNSEEKLLIDDSVSPISLNGYISCYICHCWYEEASSSHYYVFSHNYEWVINELRYDEIICYDVTIELASSIETARYFQVSSAFFEFSHDFSDEEKK